MKNHPPDRKLDPPEPTDAELREDKLREELAAIEGDLSEKCQVFSTEILCRDCREYFWWDHGTDKVCPNCGLADPEPREGYPPIHEATVNLNSLRNLVRDALGPENAHELTEPIFECLEVLKE